jgi:hypothetical protein
MVSGECALLLSVPECGAVTPTTGPERPAAETEG